MVSYHLQKSKKKIFLKIFDRYLFQKLFRVTFMIDSSIVYQGSLYQFSDKKHLRLICPIKIYPSTLPDRIKLTDFYNSIQGQEWYSQRKVSIEPLFQTLKDTFNIRTVPVKGLNNMKSFMLICVLVYQLAVYYNCVTGVRIQDL